MSLPETTADALVTVEGLHTYYGKSHILQGVSFSVGAGEIVSLLGRNGVGKSSTLRAVTGINNVSAREIAGDRGNPVEQLLVEQEILA